MSVQVRKFQFLFLTNYYILLIFPVGLIKFHKILMHFSGTEHSKNLITTQHTVYLHCTCTLHVLYIYIVHVHVYLHCTLYMYMYCISTLYIYIYVLNHYNFLFFFFLLLYVSPFFSSYLCNDWILNDTSTGDIQLIQSLLGQVAAQNYQESYTRSGRVLRPATMFTRMESR